MLKYVAIGDSLTVGYGTSPGEGFVPRYRAIAEHRLGTRIALANFGELGATTGRVARLISNDHDVRQALRVANIITITAGGNDLIDAAEQYARDHNQADFLNALAACRKHFVNIFRSIHQIKSHYQQPYIIRSVDLYNPLPQVATSSEWVKRFNEELDQFTANNMAVAKIYRSFLGRERQLIASDHIHPNARGYQVIAEQLDSLGYRPIG